MDTKKQKEYLMDMGPYHRSLEWPRGFPEVPLEEESTDLWEELGMALGDRILTMTVDQMCMRVDEVGRMDCD